MKNKAISNLKKTANKFVTKREMFGEIMGTDLSFARRLENVL